MKDSAISCSLCNAIICALYFFYQKKRRHHITSFQLFANEIRRNVQDENKDASFGDVSKIIADKVNPLPLLFYPLNSFQESLYFQ